MLRIFLPMADRIHSTPPPRFDDAADATRRTWLANERTWLAWVRTGLTSTAVALALGKVVPELARARHRWPYVVIGVGYAILGVALVAYGFVRRREVDAAIVTGRYVGPHPHALAAFAAMSVALGIGTAVVVAIS
jgi:putative membrane protein